MMSRRGVGEMVGWRGSQSADFLLVRGALRQACVTLISDMNFARFASCLLAPIEQTTSPPLLHPH